MSEQLCKCSHEKRLHESDLMTPYDFSPNECGARDCNCISFTPADDPAPDMVEKAREFAAQGDHGVDEYWLATKLADFAVSIHADLIRENGELKGKVEYFGKLADEMTALAKRNRQLEAKILAARKQLKSDHIQDNKHRLGLLGSQDIDRVYTALEDK